MIAALSSLGRRWLLPRRVQEFDHPDQHLNFGLWFQTVSSISPPTNHRTVWNPQSKTLTIVYIETRFSQFSTGVLRNIAHVYGGTDASLVILHGPSNAAQIQSIVKGWRNVHLYEIEPISDLSVYNEHLLNSRFWEIFFSEFVLITQWDSLHRHPFSKDLYEFDYVGAPWRAGPFSQRGGNGGLSLRRVEAMKRACPAMGANPIPEDIFFSTQPGLKFPCQGEAAAFSCETLFHEDPCGMHKAWKYLPHHQVSQLLTGIPGSTPIRSLVGSESSIGGVP